VYDNNQDFMKLTRKQVKKIAHLAQIKLTPEEISEFQEHLSEILSYVRQMQEIDTDYVQPTAQVSGLVNVFRNDTGQKGQRLSQKEVLANAPDQKDGYFKVKPVL